jgi:C1A family cysteine protease
MSKPRWVLVFVFGVLATSAWSDEPLPSTFDLRSVGAVTPVKQQKGGTCWTHGTMAAIESNLLISGAWKTHGGQGIPAMSEYHLDWWNGFNKHKNDDVTDPKTAPSGLTVHVGGDYRVAAAYISRGDGVVPVPFTKDDKPDILGWHSVTPERSHARRFYVRDIEWFTIGDNLENIDVVKRRLMKEGALGTAYSANSKLFLSKDFIHYQPASSENKPNHAVAIVGWDDSKIANEAVKKAPKPGAWLIKNSWGTKKGDQGYYWISFYDKVCCRDPEMGAVSFRNIEPMKYSHVYYHDYHGWRDTLRNLPRAFNAFTAVERHDIRAVSFYTAAENVKYTVKIYKKFANGKLGEEATAKSGAFAHSGFHTIDLDASVTVQKDDKFYVYLEVSAGGQAIDRTSEIPVLLGQVKPGRGPNGPLVVSKANPGESYYHDGAGWQDLYDYKFANPSWATFDRTANFCMKALAVSVNVK